MRIASEQAASSEIARELGFDMYRFGIAPDNMFDSFPAVNEGYAIARHQNVSLLHRPDRFARKLLQIRMRALRKGIVVAIGEQDLQQAYEDCNGICPVTQQPLTTASMADTDWSVDRLDNERGYLPDNIVVMSSRANKAKGVLSLEELMMYCMGGQVSLVSMQAFRQESERFWRRMFHAYYDRLPEAAIDRVLATFCSVKEKRAALVAAAMALLINISCDGGLNRAERALRENAVLGPYMMDNTIQKGDFSKLRKTALKVMRQMDNYQSGDRADDMFEMISDFMFDPRCEHIIARVIEQLEVDMTSEPSRRRIIFQTLMASVASGGKKSLSEAH